MSAIAPGPIALYLASAAAALWLAHRFVRRLSIAVAAFLSLAPLLLTGRALITGRLYAPIDIVYEGEPFASHRAEAGVQRTQTPLLSDVVYQGIPWRKAVRESVKNGRWPLWNRFVMAGTPLLAAQLSSVFSPGTWIGFLLPLPQAWTFDMTLRFLVSLLCAFLFFRELECGNLASAIGASGWAFSDFLVFLAGHPQSPAIGPFPLLLLGLRRLAREPGRNAAGVTGAALLLMVAAGHPESLLHSVAAAGIYFVTELVRLPRGKRGRPVALSLATGALVLGLSAASLLPFLEILPHTQEIRDRRELSETAREPADLGRRAAHSMTFFVPYAFGVSGQGRVESYRARPAGGYAGSLVLALAVAGVLSRRRERWLFLAYIGLGLFLFVGMPPVATAVSALPLFSLSLNHRLVFLAAFGVCALAAFGAEELRQGGGATRFVAAATGLLAVILVLFVLRAPRLLEFGMPRDFLAGRILLQTLPLVIAGAVVWGYRRRKGAVPIAVLLGLVVATRGLEGGSVHPTYPSSAFYPHLSLLDAIDRREPYRIVGTGFELVPGAAALYELEDVRGYEMTTLAALVETFPLWCVRQPVWFNRVDDAARPFLSFLNVRYALTAPSERIPDGWKTLAEDPGGRLIENPNVLPRAFVPRRVYREQDPARQRQRLLSIADFSADGVLEGAPAPPENGSARAEITAYSGQQLDLSIEARDRAVIATSLTAWPGWRLTVDGKPEKLRTYNRAFLAFEVGPGKHQARLLYWPRSFVTGLWISGVSLLVVAVWLARPRRTAESGSVRDADERPIVRLWLAATLALLFVAADAWRRIPPAYRCFVPTTPVDGMRPDIAREWAFLKGAGDFVPRGASFTVRAQDPIREMELFMVSLGVLPDRRALPSSYFAGPAEAGAIAEYVLEFGCDSPGPAAGVLVGRLPGGCVYRRGESRR
jgi:hypothetical protein